MSTITILELTRQVEESDPSQTHTIQVLASADPDTIMRAMHANAPRGGAPWCWQRTMVTLDQPGTPSVRTVLDGDGVEWEGVEAALYGAAQSRLNGEHQPVREAIEALRPLMAQVTVDSLLHCLQAGGLRTDSHTLLASIADFGRFGVALRGIAADLGAAELVVEIPAWSSDPMSYLQVELSDTVEVALPGHGIEVTARVLGQGGRKHPRTTRTTIEAATSPGEPGECYANIAGAVWENHELQLERVRTYAQDVAQPVLEHLLDICPPRARPAEPGQAADFYPAIASRAVLAFSYFHRGVASLATDPVALLPTRHGDGLELVLDKPCGSRLRLRFGGDGMVDLSLRQGAHLHGGRLELQDVLLPRAGFDLSSWLQDYLVPAQAQGHTR